MPGLIRGVARTAVIAGTATAVSNGVSRRQYGRWEQKAAQEQAQQAVDNYIRTVSGASATQQITEAKALLDSGAISAQEFEQLKARALG